MPIRVKEEYRLASQTHRRTDNTGGSNSRAGGTTECQDHHRNGDHTFSSHHARQLPYRPVACIARLRRHHHRGDNITVDFGGASLKGRQTPTIPIKPRHRDQYRRRTQRQIRNAHVRGYKIGILARGTRDLALVDNDLSDNWKPRLFSLVEHESLVDWLSHHHNEKDEWLRFGAATYLADVTAARFAAIASSRAWKG